MKKKYIKPEVICHKLSVTALPLMGSLDIEIDDPTDSKHPDTENPEVKPEGDEDPTFGDFG